MRINKMIFKGKSAFVEIGLENLCAGIWAKGG